jgi:hypothetical protein
MANPGLPKNVIRREAKNLVFLVTLDSVQDDSEISFCPSFWEKGSASAVYLIEYP